MEKCNVDHSDDKNNGLITKIWGEAGWIFGHSVTFGYPISPTDDQKQEYKNYFISLGNVLPCKYCRESYHKFITTGETALTDEVMQSRETLTKWFHNIHETVNKKLEMQYAVSYEDVVDKYESFRAKCGKNISVEKEKPKGCVTPLDYKAFSFRKLYHKDCPIVPLSVAKPFIKLAKLRNLEKEYFSFLKLADALGGDFNELKKQDAWEYRNNLCHKQIRYMRENGIDSIEKSGKFRGLPTIEELKLLVLLSSNLNNTELRDANRILSKKENFRDCRPSKNLNCLCHCKVSNNLNCLCYCHQFK